MANYKKENIPNTIALPILSLVSFGIFFSYAYFIAIIYISVLIITIIKSRRKKEKIISVQNIITIIMLIINPLILGLTYFIILPHARGIANEITSIIVNGTIYQNYITNLLPLVPIFIIAIVTAIKNKNKENKCEFSTILFILLLSINIVLSNSSK